MKHKLLLIFTIILFIILKTPVSEAINMSNTDYILRMGNLDMAAGNVSNPSYKLGFTAGETAPGLFTGPNYKVRSGFQYVNSIIPFAFSISSLFIDFGTLTPGEPITRTNTLTVSNGSANGYSVTAFENHALRMISSGVDIGDTTCDNGSCTESTAADWVSNLTYGFGYRCDNVSDTDCASGFTENGDEYKQFASDEKDETAQAVMSGANVGRDKQVQITYKVNIPGNQAAGVYQNTITYIATPTF